MSIIKKIRDFFGESTAQKMLKKYDPEFYEVEQNKEVHKDNKLVNKKIKDKK